MTVTTLIYAYMGISIALIGFNIICVWAFAKANRAIALKSIGFVGRVMEQVELIEKEEDNPEKYRAYLYRKLLKEGNLRAFDGALEDLSKTKPEVVDRYAKYVMPVFEKLITVGIKEELRLAYVLYIAKRYKMFRDEVDSPAVDKMLSLLSHESFFLRENALQLIYGVGDAKLASRAIKILDQGGYHYDEKMVSDGLMEFDGDKVVLNSELWRVHKTMSIRMQLIILNYLRFNTGDYCEQMMTILKDETLDDEIRYCAIRYFGRYRYEPAYDYLMQYMDPSWDEPWQYKSITASILATYPCERTYRALEIALHDKEWYVRFNASQSMDRLGFNYADYVDIFEGHDRYAREALQYYYDRRQLVEN